MGKDAKFFIVHIKMFQENFNSDVVLVVEVSVFVMLVNTYVPSRALTESSASLGSSNSTNAKPGGFRATHTFLNGPYLQLKIQVKSTYSAQCTLQTKTPL